MLASLAGASIPPQDFMRKPPEVEEPVVHEAERDPMVVALKKAFMGRGGTEPGVLDPSAVRAT